MMTLDELQLKRFRLHRDRTFEFKSGVTGIVGNNGAGKSSIIEAIAFLFTGDTDDPKEQVITRGGYGEALVRGKFTLNGKTGTIERHLSSSKVILEYDGVKHLKSADVKELWSKLLQVDEHIFNHVIIAKQKKIPELFSGDIAVREKSYQKIFMVPPTEKLRLLIWDKYIKDCPPPLPEDDEKFLADSLATCEAKLVPLVEQHQLYQTSLLSPQQHTSVINSVEYYKRCARDAEAKPVLEADKETILSNISKLQATLRISEQRLKVLEEMGLNKTFISMSNAKALNDNLVVLKQKRDKAKADYDGAVTALPGISTRLEELGAQLVTVNKEYGTYESEVKKLRNALNHLNGKSGSVVCNECLRPIENLAEHKAALEQSLNKASSEVLRVAEISNKLTNEQKTLVGVNATLRNMESQYNALEAELVRCKAPQEFDPVKFAEITQLVNELHMVQSRVSSLQLAVSNLNTKLVQVEERLKHLVLYDGASTPAEELSVMNEVMSVNQKRLDALSQIASHISSLRTEISILTKRIETSKKNHAWNSRRSEYINKLKGIYDLFHTANFPRKLIQTYSEVIDEGLATQLKRFDLPYDVRMSDEFKLTVFNNENLELPRLSGGQEMVVGLCLRLALHALFSQSFPMLIIDEGTTHLDEANKKLYFQCIEDLKKEKAFQQLIIIDHCSMLTDVVDQVIQI